MAVALDTRRLPPPQQPVQSCVRLPKVVKRQLPTNEPHPASRANIPQQNKHKHTAMTPTTTRNIVAHTSSAPECVATSVDADSVVVSCNRRLSMCATNVTLAPTGKTLVIFKRLLLTHATSTPLQSFRGLCRCQPIEQALPSL